MRDCPGDAESSNVDNAWRLEGKVLLIVGELDTNVDRQAGLAFEDDRFRTWNEIFESWGDNGWRR